MKERGRRVGAGRHGLGGHVLLTPRSLSHPLLAAGAGRRQYGASLSKAPTTEDGVPGTASGAGRPTAPDARRHDTWMLVTLLILNDAPYGNERDLQWPAARGIARPPRCRTAGVPDRRCRGGAKTAPGTCCARRQGTGGGAATGFARLAVGEVAGFAAAPGPAQGRLESTLAGHRLWCGDGFVDLRGRHLG